MFLLLNYNQIKTKFKILSRFFSRIFKILKRCKYCFSNFIFIDAAWFYDTNMLKKIWNKLMKKNKKKMKTYLNKYLPPNL